MRRSFQRTVVFSFWVVFALSACSAGGGSGSVPNVAANSGAGNYVAFQLMIPNAPAAQGMRRRRPAFVSPSANGAVMTVYAHADTNHTTPLARVTADISASSSTCTTASAGRNCTITISAPLGTDDFVTSLYDESPVNGAIPSSARELGTAGVTQTITAGATNSLQAPMDAVIAGLGGSTQTVAEATDGHEHFIGLVISATDFGNNPITTGTYANPITASVSDYARSGHTLLSLDGGMPATQVTITNATDTVQAVYDGAGPSGYQATIALTANPVNGQGGAMQENLVITRSNLTISNPTVFYAGFPAQLTTYPEGQQVLLISESGTPYPNQPGAISFTATTSGCANILSVGKVLPDILWALSNQGYTTMSTLLVVGGTKLSSSGCTLSINDGSASFTIPVVNTVRNIGAPSIQEYSAPSGSRPFGVTTGSDGNLWFTEQYGDALNSISTSGSVGNPISMTAAGFVQPAWITLGPDGNIWFSDTDHTAVGAWVFPPIGSIDTLTSTTQGYDGQPIAGLDGKIWFAEYVNSQGIGSINITTSCSAIQNCYVLQSTIALPSGGDAGSTTFGPDGAIWYVDSGNGAIGRVSGGVATDFAAKPTHVPYLMAAGSDGALWFMETSNAIGRMTASGQLTEYPISGIGEFITAGPDGALWFTDDANNAIGRITTSGTVTEYAIPTAGAEPFGITVGPDGNIWFTELLKDKIGVLKL